MPTKFVGAVKRTGVKKNELICIKKFYENDPMGLYYKTLRARNVKVSYCVYLLKLMDMSKLAYLSRPEDTSLPRNLSVFVNYESVMFYSKGPLCSAFFNETTSVLRLF
jgi:hypothetical protein